MKVATLMLVAVALGTSACKPAVKVDTAADEQAIRAKETAWMEAYNKHDVEAVKSQYQDDAGLAGPGAAVMTDAASRGAFLTGFASDPALKVDFASDRIMIAQSGELASSRGHYTMTYTDPGTKQPKTESGTYLTVYRKQADGSWKAVEDLTTPGPPPVPAAVTP
ncbi:nuclear transport factor 2 family protein [Sphingomonas sp. RB56-2]|uniref:Nuclear transport factor 2 family protein n=1 Tax=Sphingomonas brevis TaxID=2908206 RepID=A0ABT0S8B5_9SPHN|nr:nuclear transport factor 2 family protein [Sphingomonas brevis]MCL6740651.1 nuclear transport factor 2 family protein [Sphingomonas brevis]